MPMDSMPPQTPPDQQSYMAQNACTSDAVWRSDAVGSGLLLPSGTPVLREHLRPPGFNWPVGDGVLPDVRAYSQGTRVWCSHGPDDIFDTAVFKQKIYVDGLGGNDANDGLSWSKRKRTYTAAVAAAVASGTATDILLYAPGGPYGRNAGWTNGLATAPTAPICVQGLNGVAQVGAFDALTFTKTAGKTYTYQVNRAAAFSAVNPAIRGNPRKLDIGDLDGLMREYVWVAGADEATSIALVDATEGSWWTNGTTCYIHPHGHDVASNETVRLFLGATGAAFSGNQDVMLRNIAFMGGNIGALRIMGGTTNRVVVDRCSFLYSAISLNHGTSGNANGIRYTGGGLLAVFNSLGARNGSDFINGHSEGAALPRILVVNAHGVSNGIGANTSVQGASVHDGASIIDIGSTHQRNAGASWGHINAGTHAWGVGLNCGFSIGDQAAGGNQRWAGYGVWDGAAKMWLDSCTDAGCEVGVYAADGATAFLRNHRGTGLRLGDIRSY